ncbi:MAG: hypothetical protein KDB00_26430 [Planctomycetales bacterium]|nr:hypothetical protein [Planctomycetales bacterium]
MSSAARIVLAVCLGTLSAFTFTRESKAAEIDNPPAENQPAETVKRPSAQSDKPSVQRGLDKEIERGVLQMVDNHLPELKVLLDQLRENEPRQYELAIRNLAKSSRRLQAAQKRGEASFDLEVHIIQAQTSINLLIAKLKVRDNKKDREALLEATRRFEQAEIDRAEYELTLSQSKLAKMKEQVDAMEKLLIEKQSNMDETIKKDFQGYLRKSGRK